VFRFETPIVALELAPLAVVVSIVSSSSIASASVPRVGPSRW
jgi:hypothetical protein